MIRNVLQAIDGIGIYPVISLVLFTTFFAGMLVWVFRMKKSTLLEVGRLPLQDDATPSPRHGENHV